MELNIRKIPRPIYLRYILLNIPGLMAVILILIIIQHWVVLPVWLFWSIVGFWVVKDAVLFPFVWRAYDWERPGRSRSMIGERGIAKERLAPETLDKLKRLDLMSYYDVLPRNLKALIESSA